jgi:hypothetical protein
VNTYVIHTTDGYTVNVKSNTDPSNHPTFAGRIECMEIFRNPYAHCADCGKPLSGEFDDFGAKSHPRCFSCGMIDLDRRGLSLD